jgi:hypothetical protein
MRGISRFEMGRQSAPGQPYCLDTPQAHMVAVESKIQDETPSNP